MKPVDHPVLNQALGFNCSGTSLIVGAPHGFSHSVLFCIYFYFTLVLCSPVRVTWSFVSKSVNYCVSPILSVDTHDPHFTHGLVYLHCNYDITTHSITL